MRLYSDFTYSRCAVLKLDMLVGRGGGRSQWRLPPGPGYAGAVPRPFFTHYAHPRSDPAMFAVSRKSQAHHQFNQRSPKPGPVSTPRHMDLSLRRTPSEARTPKRPGMASPAPSSAARPIATNSRVKDKEDRVRTAYLAFAREALQNKANVRLQHLHGTRPRTRSNFGHRATTRGTTRC
jgi:hypothetical protein